MYNSGVMDKQETMLLHMLVCHERFQKVMNEVCDNSMLFSCFSKERHLSALSVIMFVVVAQNFWEISLNVSVATFWHLSS